MNQYVGGKLVRSLSGVETGQCTNGSWTTLSGNYVNEPRIIVSPKSLMSYKAANSASNQSLNCSVKYVESLGNYKWRFQPAATLNTSASQDFISVPATKKYGTELVPWTTGTSAVTLTTDAVSTGGNCTKITMTATMRSYCTSGSSAGSFMEYAYTANIKYRIKYKLSSASSWSYSSYCTVKNGVSREDSYTTTITQSVSSGTYDVCAEYLIQPVASPNTKRSADFSYENSIQVNSIECARGSTSNLATGTLNYIAIGR